MKTTKKYSEKSLKHILNNICTSDIAPTITANAMQSINHQNCVLVWVNVDEKNET